MSTIHVLDETTINQIAAGEVVERPSAVVKELIENAMDAGATAITAEIKEGGLSLIRITDNGSGIAGEDIPYAFMRHATSKIRSAEDLLSVTSLGFRGEALSSIAAVSQVELITKMTSALNGIRYIIEGGEEKALEEIGCPSGTTILVRNIFYNTPARRKFLKTAVTEAGYVSDLMERLMVSHPEISFKFIVNNQVKLQSSGNGNSKDILYNVYGRDISRELLPVEYHSENLSISGFIGKPSVNRGNRNFENYFINGRYIKSSIITKAIEEAYKSFLMQHKYPFTSLYYDIDPSLIDVNVHPQKLEVRLKNAEEVFQVTQSLIKEILSGRELIPRVSMSKHTEDREKVMHHLPEPFEENRRMQLEALRIMAPDTDIPVSSESRSLEDTKNKATFLKEDTGYFRDTPAVKNPATFNKAVSDVSLQITETQAIQTKEQMTLFPGHEPKEAAKFLSGDARKEHKIIGQIFSTYWLVEYQNELFIIDQHAAHERVLYERIMAAAGNKTYESQLLLPPIVLTLSLREQEIISRYGETLSSLGYEFEHFGGNEYSVRAVPADLYGLSERDLILEFIDEMSEEFSGGFPNPDSILERVASLSCKAAVKANHAFSVKEAEALIGELLTLNNPYHCPHGRPVIISMSKYELEKKFKRIV